MWVMVEKHMISLHDPREFHCDPISWNETHQTRQRQVRSGFVIQ